METVSEWRKHLSYLEWALSLGSQFPGGVIEMEISCFQPHLVSHFPGGEVPCVSFSHDLMGCFMHC